MRAPVGMIVFASLFILVACVTDNTDTCPNGYGTTYSKTAERYIVGNNIAEYTDPGSDFAFCKAQCEATTDCVSIEVDWLMGTCNIASVTKSDVSEADWATDNPFVDYYQRDCA